MSAMPKLPGVFVEEVDSISFAISSAATAVPVFVVGKTEDEAWWDLAGNKPAKITAFEDFLNWENRDDEAGESAAYSVTLSAFWRRQSDTSNGPKHLQRLSNLKKTNTQGSVKGDPWDKVFAPSLKAYFENGGGYCYVCPNDQLDCINNLPDATLIVQCGQDEELIGEILKYCEPGSGRFALLDGPKNTGAFDANRFASFYTKLAPSDCAAVFYPWLRASWSLQDNSKKPVKPEDIHLVAPSAVAAGLICKIDKSRGTWKAPANVAVSAGLMPAVKVGDNTQASYSDPKKMAVNMIRTYPGKGTLVWGARTLTTGGSNWSYISVRRTFDMVERDISNAIQAMLFEPNGQVLWEVVRAAIDNYLYNLWLKGALSGENVARSYFIHLGENITMTKADIDSGILKVRVGLAVVRPAEFVILEFTQQVASAA